MPVRRSPEATDALRASLVEHASRLVQRDGPHALTMRALADEAGYAVGLPYTVFANREALVAELVQVEFRGMLEALDGWGAAVGRRTVGQNLMRYARIMLSDRDAPAFVLADEISDDAFRAAVAEKADESGLLTSFATAVADYLAAEQRVGRVDAAIDAAAYGFLITGAVHNLLVSGPAYPRPSDRQLRRFLVAIADNLAPRSPT